MTQDAAKLPATDAAFQTLYQQVYIPYFVEKLASYGLQPRTEQALENALKLARRIEAEDERKQAAVQDVFGAVLAGLGEQPSQPNVIPDHEYKSAATQLASVAPDIFQSALALQAAAAAA